MAQPMIDTQHIGGHSLLREAVSLLKLTADIPGPPRQAQQRIRVECKRSAGNPVKDQSNGTPQNPNGFRRRNTGLNISRIAHEQRIRHCYFFRREQRAVKPIVRHLTETCPS